MICQKCKEKEATAHIKSTINGKTIELDLCSDCAQKMAYGSFLPYFNFNDILGGFIGSAGKENALRCPVCGSSFDDISKHGQVGCGKCYEVFYDKLLPMIQRIHGTTEHKGKRPGRTTAIVVKDEEPKEMAVSPVNEINQKRAELKQAIEEQRFEDAARIRDEIKEMETNE